MLLNKEATFMFAREMCKSRQQSVYIYEVPIGDSVTYMYGVHGTQQMLQNKYKRAVVCVGRYDWTEEGLKEYV